jgi:hypothetical protein
MNKREVVWLIVRLIGVYFVYSAFVTVFSVVSAVTALTALSSDTSPNSQSTVEVNRISANPTRPEPEPRPKADPATEKLKSDAFKSILLYIFLTALYGGAGFYLIRKGGILFNILASDGSAERRPDNPTVTTLKL